MDFTPKTIFNTICMVYCSIFTLLQVSCAVHSSEIHDSNPKTHQKVPKIVFLNYAITKTKQNLPSFKLLTTKTTTGRLKQSNAGTHSTNSADGFVCLQLDAESRVMDKHYINNPLKQTVEYLDANNHFKIKTIALDSAQFTIRLQLHPKTTHIAINTHEDVPLLVTKTKAL